MPILLRRTACLVLIAVWACSLLVALHPAGARADGDPASDALLYTNVFPPLSFRSGDPRTNALEAQAGAAAKAGKPVKLAIISNAQDLGSVPVLFGKPQAYARFLAAEIVYKFVGPLVVVMPQGIAVTPEPPTGSKLAVARTKAAQAAITAATITPGNTPAQLAVAAGKAITAISGVQSSAVLAKDGSSGSKSGSDKGGISAQTFLEVVIGIVVLFAIIAGIMALRGRRRRFAEDIVRGKK